MAGPWFAVQRSNAGWQPLDTIWISNAGATAKARVELRVEFEEVAENDDDI